MAGNRKTWHVTILTDDGQTLLAYAYLPDWNEVITYFSMMRELWPDVQILIWPPTNGGGVFTWGDC